MALQNHPSEEMHRRSMDAFDCLYEESKGRAKIMSIAVHPYLSGQTHRIKHALCCHMVSPGHHRKCDRAVILTDRAVRSGAP